MLKRYGVEILLTAASLVVILGALALGGGCDSGTRVYYPSAITDTILVGVDTVRVAAEPETLWVAPDYRAYMECLAQMIDATVPEPHASRIKGRLASCVPASP